MPRPTPDRLARQVAQAAGTFEHVLLGRAPAAVTVVSSPAGLVLSLHEPLAPAERRLAGEARGARRVREFHGQLFEQSLAALVAHVHRRTGVVFHGAVAHVDTCGGGILKTFTTRADVELFVLGRGVPALGVPVDAHLHANGVPHPIAAGGNGAARA